MQKSNSKSSASKATPAKAAPSKTLGASSTPAIVETPAQHKAFEAGMVSFHEREFAKAKQHFQSALEGPAKEIVYAARQHLLMCEQRLEKAEVRFETAEDYYNFAISQMNKRDADGAVQSLEKALILGEADYIHLAMALALGMKHDINGAARHLQRAIEIHPRNRIAAHNDPDFAELMHHAPIRQLLQSSGQA